MNTRQMRHLCNQLRRCFNSSERFVKAVKYDAHDRRHFAIAGYSIRTLDYFSGTISALSKREYVSVPSITRSGVEAFLYFTNLIKHENYDTLILVGVYKEKLRAAKNAEEIPSLNAETQTNEFMEHKASIQAKIESLSEHMEDYKNLCGSIKQRFEAADMRELYLSMYNIFCGESHSDMISLEGGNMEGDEEAWTFRRRKVPNRDTFLYVNTLLDLLMAIPTKLNEFLKLEREAELQEISTLIESTRTLSPL